LKLRKIKNIKHYICVLNILEEFLYNYLITLYYWYNPKNCINLEPWNANRNSPCGNAKEKKISMKSSLNILIIKYSHLLAHGDRTIFNIFFVHENEKKKCCKIWNHQ